MNKEFFGRTKNNEEIYRITLENKNGMRVYLLSYGGIIQSISLPDNNGRAAELCLGYETLEEYENGNCFFGASIGRHANRIGGGSFQINGISYQLEKNNLGNNLHGGSGGFHSKVYEIGEKESGVIFSRTSPHLESGFPGNLQVKLSYTLGDDNGLEIAYHAICDADTIVNLTNHSYFNLSGAGSREITDHILQINADKYTEIDENGLATGIIADVENTPFDFRTPKLIGESVDSSFEQIKLGHGYDHNFILSGGDGLKTAASAHSSKSGISLEVLTTKPGMQFYSGNFMESCRGIGGAYNRRGGFCLETQYFPNGMAHENFPSPLLKAGEIYSHKTVYRFKCEK